MRAPIRRQPERPASILILDADADPAAPEASDIAYVTEVVLDAEGTASFTAALPDGLDYWLASSVPGGERYVAMLDGSPGDPGADADGAADGPADGGSSGGGLSQPGRGGQAAQEPGSADVAGLGRARHHSPVLARQRSAASAAAAAMSSSISGERRTANETYAPRPPATGRP